MPPIPANYSRADKYQSILEELAVQVQARQTQLNPLPQERALLCACPFHLLLAHAHLWLVRQWHAQGIAASTKRDGCAAGHMQIWAHKCPKPAAPSSWGCAQCCR